MSHDLLLKNLLVTFWAAVNERPEAVRYLLNNRIDLIEGFPESKEDLVVFLRDLWAIAPANLDKFGGREGLERAAAERKAKLAAKAPPVRPCFYKVCFHVSMLI